MTNPRNTWREPRPAALHCVAASGMTLGEAMDAGGLSGGCALLTAPSAYHVARVTEGGCVTRTGPVDLSTVYEARAFTPKAELRWVEAGYAVLLAEDENLLAGSSWERLEPIRAVDTMDTRYLVWGTLKDADVGWATLASARIGTLAVPLPTAVPLSVVSRGRIRLVTREYVVVDREHGNAHVAEERLLGFELYDLEGAI
ncbi:type III-D CRISPR-associated protein Csx19 [Sphaerimonospora mesophila]|uniref:type III-D CRISPR-associated protein Csx19 n=1 Tax=Sphaerimonospora mesophila TaxID=37483 RepID=UPI0006E1F245